MRLLSNIKNLDAHLQGSSSIRHETLPTGGFWTGWRVFRRSFRHDVILIDCYAPYLWLLCLLRWLVPFQRCRLILLDVLFVKPVTFRQKLRAFYHRLLLKRVDHFIHYFKDLSAYEKWFGIGWDRSTYVPFKANFFEMLPPAQELSPDGDHVFAGGRSQRDIPTFLAAMALVPYPGVLFYDDPARMESNGSPLDLSAVPPNVLAVQSEPGPTPWLTQIQRAKVVVVPVLGDSIRAIGISTYLQAMAAKKCTVVTESPATRGIIDDQALVVPADDPPALADAIRRAWEDDALRRKTAEAGRRYVESLGGTDAYYERVLDVVRKVAAPRAT